MVKDTMTGKEYSDKSRYYYWHLFALPVIILVSIYAVGSIIETLFKFELGVAKTIFVGIGGVGYFIYYFRKHLRKLLE